MNQGGNVPAVASHNPNPAEANQVTSGAHGYAAYYSLVPAYDASAWGTQRTDSSPSGTVITPNNNYSYPQTTETQQKSVQDTVNVKSQDSLGSGISLPQEYTSYPPYQSSVDPYNYSNTAHQNYYNNYQQQSTQASTQPAGAYQNIGAPYQHISSFQNTGSFAEPATYSSTYYSTGGYQTSSGSYQNQTTAGGYPATSYHNQANAWNGGGHANYSSQQQTYYAPDSNGAYNSASTNSTVAQYQQQYAQWADYYNQSDVSCAPGTENISKPAAPNPGYAVPVVSSTYSATVTQQPQPVIPPSRLEPSPTKLSASQV